MKKRDVTSVEHVHGQKKSLLTMIYLFVHQHHQYTIEVDKYNTTISQVQVWKTGRKKGEGGKQSTSVEDLEGAKK